jgi:uncharacterized membrane protein
MGDTNRMQEPVFDSDVESIDHAQTFMIHFFRSETSREMAWRRRLDVSTSGAVFATGGMISFAFTSSDAGHVILLANVLLLFLFLQIEARRYQVYAKVSTRIRLIEKDYIAPLFNQIALEPKAIAYEPHVDAQLIDSLLGQRSPVSHFEAMIWRLRINYIYLLGITYVMWLIMILNGRRGQPWLDHINQQARVGEIPGTVMFVLFASVMLTALILSLSVTRMVNDHDAAV